MLSVSAEELSTGKKSEIQVKPSYGLESSVIGEMLQASHDNAQADMEVRAIKEAQLEARQLIDAIYNAREVDGALLTEEESDRIAGVISNLETAMNEAGSNQIHALTEELNRVSGNFAARRMDLHIGEALLGESIDEVEQS